MLNFEMKSIMTALSFYFITVACWKAGLVTAKARGRCGGRPRLMDENKIQQAKALLNEKKFSVPEICRSLGGFRGGRFIGAWAALRRLPKPG